MTSPKLGFLDLPAEIRNEIYSHLINDVDTNVGHKTIRLRPRRDFSSHWRRRNPHRGEVYAMNQICRATRREFGPLYVSEISHRIRVDDKILPRFLHDFFFSEEAYDCFALRPKKLEIELNYPLGGDPPRTDVLPLLTLILGNEDLQCTFLNKFGPMPEVNSVFHGHVIAWGDAILDDLLEVLLYTPHGTTTVVHLVFRDNGKHAFVEELRPIGFRPLPSARSYVERLGSTDFLTWQEIVDDWDPSGRVKFVLSKKAPGSASREQVKAAKAFETQYRLMQQN